MTVFLSKLYGKRSHKNKKAKWCYAWELSNIIKYKKPIPYCHPRGAVIWVKLN